MKNRLLRVLIIDDSEDDALLVSRELGLAGFEVDFTRVDTTEGLQAALAEAERDIIILDFSLPRLDALRTLAFLKKESHDLPVIIVSGTIGEEMAVAAMKAGASDYILKGSLSRLAPAVFRELEEAENRRRKRKAEEALLRSTEEIKRLSEENAVLAKISRIISSTLKVEDIYEQFAGEVRKLIPFDRISVVLEEADAKSGWIAYSAGVEIASGKKGEVFPLPGSFLAAIKESRSGIIAQPDSREELLDPFPILLPNYQAGLRSFLGVPLISGDRVIGALMVHSLWPKAYRPSELNLAERISGQIAGAIANARLFAAHERANEQIKASLQEKEILLKEIHHRVKNNLQVISSLLNLQSRYIKDPQYLEMFRESQNRVKSMGLIHEKLYQSRDLGRIDFSEYLQTLASHLLATYRVNPAQIRVRIEAESIFLRVDTALPCGLIINELASNSLKHAFPPGKGGEILVRLSREEVSGYLLRVRDNGAVFPPDLDFRNTPSLGLQLVNTLVRQLNGTIDLNRGGGTEFVIRFPAESS